MLLLEERERNILSEKENAYEEETALYLSLLISGWAMPGTWKAGISRRRKSAGRKEKRGREEGDACLLLPVPLCCSAACSLKRCLYGRRRGSLACCM